MIWNYSIKQLFPGCIFNCFLFNFLIVIHIFSNTFIFDIVLFLRKVSYYIVFHIPRRIYYIPKGHRCVTRNCTKFDYRFVRTSILHHFKSKGLTYTSPRVSNNGTLYIYVPTESPLSLDLSSCGKSGFQRPDQWLRRCSFLYQNGLDMTKEISSRRDMFLKWSLDILILYKKKIYIHRKGTWHSFLNGSYLVPSINISAERDTKINYKFNDPVLNRECQFILYLICIPHE